MPELETCKDFACPKHSRISLRGRSFKGTVIKKFPKRVVIEFERTIYIEKYERYARRKTKLHARLPECMNKKIEVGDYIEIRECRPISKIIHFVVVKKLHSQFFDSQKSKILEKASNIEMERKARGKKDEEMSSERDYIDERESSKSSKISQTRDSDRINVSDTSEKGVEDTRGSEQIKKEKGPRDKKLKDEGEEK